MYLQAAPIDVAPILREKLFDQVPSIILTSATLAVAGTFEFAEKRLGIRYARTLIVPGSFDLEPLARVRSVRAFDEAYTAPHHGFRDADDYYYRASALRVVARIAVPALIIASARRWKSP